MSVHNHEIAAAIDDARAFMDALLQSDWQELHIARNGFELFIARDGGGPNPMVEVAADDQADSPVAAASPVMISSPHVATVVWLAAQGDYVAAGEPVARLSVLDEEFEIKAGGSGRIRMVSAAPDQLVEFGLPLLQIIEEG